MSRTPACSVMAGLMALTMVAACTPGGGNSRPVQVSASAPSETIDEIKAKAQAGDASSQVKLGKRYMNGNGIPQDYAEAMIWLQKALNADPEAANAIGILYHNGWGVPQDYNRSAEYYRRAAEKGNVPAEFNLGYAYK